MESLSSPNDFVYLTFSSATIVDNSIKKAMNVDIVNNNLWLDGVPNNKTINSQFYVELVNVFIASHVYTKCVE